MALVAAVGFAIYFVAGKSVVETPRVLSFPEALVKADRMDVAAAGLGKIERSKMIEGRLYQNLVQMLLVSHLLYENPQDTFKADCAFGANVTLYNGADTLGRFRFTTAFGREGEVGYWTPANVIKVNKFLKDVGVPFRGCKTEIEKVADDSGKTPIISVPKFKKHHGKRGVDTTDARQEANDAGQVFTLSDSVKKQVALAQDLLSELIFPKDTALGTPLYEIALNCNRAEVVFNCNESCQGEGHDAPKKVVLDSAQFNIYRSLLKNPTIETFAGSAMKTLRAEAVVTLYKDSAEVIELWAVGNGFGNVEKHQRGENFEQGGNWFVKESKDLDTLFALIKKLAYEKAQ